MLVESFNCCFLSVVYWIQVLLVGLFIRRIRVNKITSCNPKSHEYQLVEMMQGWMRHPGKTEHPNLIAASNKVFTYL